jgi:uncharacterized protein YbjT (DUF2867 family)
LTLWAADLAGAQHTPTGPEALTFARVAEIISEVTGQLMRYQDVDRTTWIDAVATTGFVPADYGAVLDWQTTTVASGTGSRPTDDVYKVTGGRRPASPTSPAGRGPRRRASEHANP